MDLNAPPPDDAELPAIVDGLVARAASPSLDDRRAAVEGLYELACKIGPRIAAAIPALVEALHDPDPKLGDSASWALKYCSPDSIEPLAACLAGPHAVVRERAAQSLGNIGDDARPAVPRLLGLLADDDPAVRRRAAWAIGLTHDTQPRTIAALFDRVAAGTAADAAAALHALGNIGKALDDPAPLVARRGLVMDAVRQADADVRASALYVVESLGLAPQDHADLLSAVLRGEPPGRVRDTALRTLAKLAPATELAALLPTLCALVDTRGGDARLACEVIAAMQPAPRGAADCLRRALDDDDLVLQAAAALWHVEPRAEPLLPVLERVFDDRGEEVCDLICTLGPAAAPLLPKLIAALAEENWDLQWAAADALGAVASPDPRVIDALLEALRHPSPIVRSSAARALARTGDAAVPRLRALVADRADAASAWAAFTLGRIGPAAAAAGPELRAGLRAGVEPLCSCCAIALALIDGDAEVLPYLIDALRSDDPQAPRKAAASAIGHLGPLAASAAPALEVLLDDEDGDLVDAAQTALSSIQGAMH